MLTIKVFKSDGKTPADGVDMVLSGPGDFGTFRDKSDESGEFGILDCPDGDYVIKAAAGGDKQTQNLTIVDGEDESVKFVMEVE